LEIRRVEKIMGFLDRFRKKKREEPAEEESSKEESSKEESS